MNKEDLLQLSRQQFPKAIGFLLTGSQVRNTVFNLVSDIDVMVFDITNSDIYSRGFVYKQHRIDFTIVAVLDIENTCINEFSDNKGTYLTMLANGSILEDPYLILKSIQIAILPLVHKINNKVKGDYKNLLNHLLKMRKYLDRDLQEYERIFLISEFVETISNLEIIRVTGKETDRLQKVKQLNEYIPDFVLDIVKLYKQALLDDHLTSLISYINYYQNRVTFQDDQLPPSIIFDIALPNFSLKQFNQQFVPAIASNEILKNHYRYFYKSPKKYYRKYKNDISICFSLRDQISIVDIANELSSIFNPSNENKIFRYEIIYPLEKFINFKISNKIEGLREMLCRLSSALHSDNNLFSFKPFDIALALCCKVKHLSTLHTEDICYLNNFLMQRWLIALPEHKNAQSYQYLIAVGKEKQKEWDVQYEFDKKLLLPFIRSGISQHELALHDDAGLLYTEVVINMEEILSNKNFDFKTLYMPDSLLQYIKATLKRESRAYLILVEEILQMFNLKESDKARCLYFMSKGLMELLFL